MTPNPLQRIESLGQSFWLDYMQRDLLSSGDLQRMILSDRITGIASSSAIFGKAIAESSQYDQTIDDLVRFDKSSAEIYELLSQQDVQNAADEFRPMYDRTEGKDGYVSIELNPHLAHDTYGTITEARRLWSALDRPNVLIKIPATKDGLPAIEQLISEGINVNVTLIFGLPRYRQVVEAFMTGLEARTAKGKPLDYVASVASFFLNRIDAMVDPQVEVFMGQNSKDNQIAKAVHGQVAISTAKVAYEIYKEVFNSNRFMKMAENGARAQRLLWASTSNKNPVYSDLKYIDPLIGRDTICSMSLQTLNAYRDHGIAVLRLDEYLHESNWVMSHLPELGIDINKLTQDLEDEGLRRFIEPFDTLMDALTKKASAALIREGNAYAVDY